MNLEQKSGQPRTKTNKKAKQQKNNKLFLRNNWLFIPVKLKTEFK